MCVVSAAQQIWRKAKDAGDPFEKVFCVFDRDTHGDYQRALDTLARIRPKGVFVAIPSVPCFEYWLLLHFAYTDQPFHAASMRSVGAMVLRELRRYWPGYEKAFHGVFEQRLEQLEFAKANAVRALKAAQTAHTDNPSTLVHELVEYLQRLKQ